MDRDIYKSTMQKELLESDQSHKLSLFEGNVHDLLIDSEGKCTGISMEDGTKLTAKSVVLTTGTFLDAKCYIGQDEMIKAGRFMRHTDKTESNEMKVEPASTALAESIKKLKFLNIDIESLPQDLLKGCENLTEIVIQSTTTIRRLTKDFFQDTCGFL